jgi:hypothetical protein
MVIAALISSPIFTLCWTYFDAKCLQALLLLYQDVSKFSVSAVVIKTLSFFLLRIAGLVKVII